MDATAKKKEKERKKGNATEMRDRLMDSRENALIGSGGNDSGRKTKQADEREGRDKIKGDKERISARGW